MLMKNKLIRRIALLASVIMLLTSAVNTTYGFIVTQTDSLINTFVPLSSNVSNIVINKSVEHSLGNDYKIPDNIAFDFKVELGLLYANTSLKTDKGDIVTDKNGEFTVSVKPNIPFKIEGIDVGTKIKVTEIQKEGNGFTVKDGAIKEATVSESGGAEVKFINTYNPKAVSLVNVTVEGTKILEGRDWQTGDTFAFILESKNQNGVWEKLSEKTVTFDEKNKDFNKFSFSDIIKTLEFTKVGTYKFRMSEVIGNLENVDYDKSINTFEIKVTDTDMDGMLEIGGVTAGQNASVSTKNGNYNVAVTFNNTFVPAISEPDDISVDITVNKTVKSTGKLSITSAGFEFVLENSETKEKTVLESGEDGKAVFKLPFTAKDIGKTYTYKLYERNNGIDGVTYDTSVYDININITEQNNMIIASVTVDGKGVDTVLLEFENIYHKTTPPTGDNNITFWFVLMIISAMSCIALIVLDRKYIKSLKD
ncbi:MAG: hypothetical protein E7568_05940 [Ruminococcaceae bacterium]|nr:hypothetical protein [Oscillospiraceae bacterium]